jgi:hypothetical protein
MSSFSSDDHSHRHDSRISELLLFIISATSASAAKLFSTLVEPQTQTNMIPNTKDQQGPQRTIISLT